jgi:hypothetical protein
MTDEEFETYLAGGIDIKGQRITGRVLLANRHRLTNGTQADSPFVVQINHGDELSIRFDPDEDLEARMAKLDNAVLRWLTIRPSPPRAEIPRSPEAAG